MPSLSLKKTIDFALLPVHSLHADSMQINILQLDHTNPYDFKREHRQSYFEVMLIEKGGCSQLIDFTNYVGSDYSCYIICPQQIHLMNRNAASGLVVQFTEERLISSELLTELRQLLFHENAAIIFENQFDSFSELLTLIQLLVRQLQKSDIANKQVITYLLKAIVALILEHKRLKNSNSNHSNKSLLIAYYLLIEKHYYQNVGVQFYIKQLNTNEKKLAETTKKFTGYSPLQLIHNRILLEAKRLLVFEDLSHKEIAYRLGFDSPASFSHFIKTKTSQTPLELAQHLAEIHK